MEAFKVVKVTGEVGSYCKPKDVANSKKKKNKCQDSVEKPKKPRSAYLLYYFDVQQLMQQEVPNIPQSEINKRISKNWKRLSVAEKAYYLEKAKSEKEGTFSLSPSKDVPGFRRILPRGNFRLLSKDRNQQPGSSQSKVRGASLNPSVEGRLASVALSKERQLTGLGLASEVELSEQAAIDEDGAKKTKVVSYPSEPCEILSSSSLILPKAPPGAGGDYASQNSADNPTSVVTLQGAEPSPACHAYGGPALQQGDTTQTVAIIPAQSLLEPTSSPAVSSVRSLMMVAIGDGREPSAKPSYKMPVKTYTRRGRGRCPIPGCTFVYVTRHKPPTCPQCGHYLGGKWVPAAKKRKGNEVVSAPQEAVSKPGENRLATLPADRPGEADGSKTNVAAEKREGQVQRRSRKRHAVPAEKPPEGAIMTAPDQIKQTQGSVKPVSVKGQERRLAAVQKRPVRPILPAHSNSGHVMLQVLSVPPQKSANNKSPAVFPTTPQQDNFSLLKPSTLKQLGCSVPAADAKQDSPAVMDGRQAMSPVADKKVNLLTFVPLRQQHTVAHLNLGLSTGRGRGRCKNQSCDYIYKNRHKPAVCPKCGCELTQKNAKGTKSIPVQLLDPQQPLSPAQRDVQRQNTVQLLHRTLQIPESETELQETLRLIQELNSLRIVLVQSSDQVQDSRVETETLMECGWPQCYESAVTHCGLCNYPLFKGDESTIAGREECWLLTETLVQTVSLQLKVCLNAQCLALHSFTELPAGLFNIGNRLLVSIDLFLKIRASIKLGQSPTEVVRVLFDHTPNHMVHSLVSEELSKIRELLLNGYWAFECLTVRDYNDMICGICGVTPKLEIAQRYRNNVLELNSVEFTWPEVSVSDEVLVDDFWLTMESEAIEQAAFPTDIPITRVDASIIAPFIPPLMRSASVINTEKDKLLTPSSQPTGDPSVFVRLIHDGQLRLEQVEDHTEDELRGILEQCGQSVPSGATKSELLASIISLYTQVRSGLSTAPQPSAHLTAGKLSKLCPHKVVCGSKYLVRGETARDHVDLLLSSRYWPPVYVSDCARMVALCADVLHPELATRMWGRNQGCFSDPFDKPRVVCCAELHEQPYSADLSFVAENQLVHPITKSPSCWLVHPPGSANNRSERPLEHHSMSLCQDLEPYIDLIAEATEGEEVEGEQTKEAGKTESDSADGCPSVDHARKQPAVFSNPAYYYLYNRLVDFLTSRDIVCQQINQVVQACQPGEVVIRDALCRLGVAQIKTEREEDEGSEVEMEAPEGGENACEVLLPE